MVPFHSPQDSGIKEVMSTEETTLPLLRKAREPIPLAVEDPVARAKEEKA
jgi:hypothetical protein